MMPCWLLILLVYGAFAGFGSLSLLNWLLLIPCLLRDLDAIRNFKRHRSDHLALQKIVAIHLAGNSPFPPKEQEHE